MGYLEVLFSENRQVFIVNPASGCVDLIVDPTSQSWSVVTPSAERLLKVAHDLESLFMHCLAYIITEVSIY